MVLKDQTLRRIARKTGHISNDLGYELDLEFDDIKLLERKYSDPVEQAFHIIMVSKHSDPASYILKVSKHSDPVDQTTTLSTSS